jgi:hypothetical protein
MIFPGNKISMSGKVRLHISFTVRDEATFVGPATNVVKTSQVTQSGTHIVRLHISFTVRDEATFVGPAANVVKTSQVRQSTIITWQVSGL